MRKMVFFLAALLVFGSSCHKKKDGKTLLRTITMHHTKYIDSCVVYIKYNATDVPASYDDSVKVADSAGIPVATFGPLSPGNYYLFGYGYDTSINEIVYGGIPYNVPEREDDGIAEVVVPVTEDH